MYPGTASGQLARTRLVAAGRLASSPGPYSRRGAGQLGTSGQLGHDLGSARFPLSHEQAKEQQGPTSVRERAPQANFSETGQHKQPLWAPSVEHHAGVEAAAEPQ
jgi:hypothetical protein